ncbi:MAG: DUF3658 domain-containing protein [Candidatus Thiodiazotropha lotti]|nr:DUF3658 domain-containing protein [Candidatus Thiodiazotropha lotti]
MENHDAKPDGKLTPEQEILAGQLTEDEVHEIDIALLSNTNDRWRKVAMVVATTMMELPCRIKGIPDIYYSQRIRYLVDKKELIARGDLSCMRYSEVRKPVENKVVSMSGKNENEISEPASQSMAMLKKLHEMMEARDDRNAKNPDFDFLPASYLERCQEWAKLDFWSLDEAANLLAGTDPKRPKIDGHTELNERIEQISQWLKFSDVKTEGKLNKRYEAKGVMVWARKKSVEIPEALLEAMGFSEPKSSKHVHGNTLKNLEKREKVLGAAIIALANYSAQCKDRGDVFTGTSIATFLEQRPELFFEEGVPPYTVRVMAGHINQYLTMK